MNRRQFLRAAAGSTVAFGAWDASAAGREGAVADGTRSGNTISLAGAWAFRADTKNEGEAQGWPAQPPIGEAWGEASVPGCWERDGQPGTLIGPAWYQRAVTLPPAWRAPGLRLWWENDAVSYHAQGWAGGRPLGEHTGMWDAFAWEVPQAAVQEGALALSLKVEKPGGRFPIKETMAGFLPYVWGTWGGPWQESRLRLTGPVAIQRVWAPGSGDGIVAAEADVAVAPGTEAAIRFELRDAAGRTVARREVPVVESGTVAAPLRVAQARRWTPESPILYTLIVTALVDDRVSDTRARRVGFRTITTRGETVLLNGEPVYFRAPLSWGWYETERAPNPPPEVFAEELRRVRALGFNGMKLCLWIPPPVYFDIADTLGMLLWVELPMWLPEGTPFARRQTPDEYRRIVRQVGDHPSVLLWTIGCEIGRGVDAAFLGGLYRQVKEQTGSNLVRDNSGSAECYGGPLPEHADYWDFHFYCDLPFARPTFDAFAPRWRQPQPWLFGEFNDQDALRDLPGLIEAREGDVPWWAKNDPAFNPQGVRWEYGVVEQRDRMKARDLLRRVSELRESSRKQALLNRKVTLETVRAYPFMSGYVVTGLADTPISTAGLFDDFGQARFTPEEFTPFNADTVLVIEPDRRRAWVAGGDRPRFLDRCCVWADTDVRRHVGVSHFGREDGPARLTWRATRESGETLREGRLELRRLSPGAFAEIGLLEFAAPKTSRPEKMTLALTLSLGQRQIVNAWPFWVFPKPAKDEARRVGLFDPSGQLAGMEAAVGIAPAPLDAFGGEPVDGKGPVPLIAATSWRPEMRGYLRGGGKILLVQPGAQTDGLPAAPVPFWREAMKLFEPHPSWGAFPHEKWTDLQFYGLACDAAFDREKVQAALEADVTPVLTRVDARSLSLHGYTLSANVGPGTLLMTTLRPQGGLGDQPSGLARHVAGAYLLRTWLDWLSRT